VPIKMPVDANQGRKMRANWDTIGRRRPGVGLTEVQANFETLLDVSRSFEPRFHKSTQLRVTPFEDRLTGDVRTVLLILLGGVTGVLLIASCECRQSFCSPAPQRGNAKLPPGLRLAHRDSASSVSSSPKAFSSPPWAPPPEFSSPSLPCER
jgi:hypothetical protein